MVAIEYSGAPADIFFYNVSLLSGNDFDLITSLYHGEEFGPWLESGRLEVSDTITRITKSGVYFMAHFLQRASGLLKTEILPWERI